MRMYRNREIELLAPVKTFEDFLITIHSKCDAVYFGGKKFNMRVHNSAYNLTNEEIKKAVKIAHDLGKKVYITFNNMMNDSELEEAVAFLTFLGTVKPDALIIQDFGALKLIKDLNLELECHLSVMANVHNADMVKAALELGITRVVLSREMHLHQVNDLVEEIPEMEYEYFTHGDMCTVNGAQCHYSGTLFGNSGNRGKCMKPCRWKFMSDGKQIEHPFAAKDLSLYRHLPQLIHAGVNSFKIEGRMRDVHYMVDLINLYADAIDRYLTDPTGYTVDSEAVRKLQENRIRNISTGYAFKKPGAINIDPGGREPRVFSQPIEERGITEKAVVKAQNRLYSESAVNENGFKVAVTINDMEQFSAALEFGVVHIYLSLEVFRPKKPFTLEQFELMGKMAAEAEKENGFKQKLYLVLPRMETKQQSLVIDELLPKLAEWGFYGLLVNNIGQIRRYAHYGFEMVGDYGLNVYNKQAAEFYKSLGLSRCTLSIEATSDVMKNFLGNNDTLTEIIVQGAPTIMYLDHCLKAAEHGVTAEDWCEDYCINESMDLTDESGFTHPVRADQFCKNHVLPIKDICYLPVIHQIRRFGIDAIRFDAREYTPKIMCTLIRMYRYHLMFEGEDLQEGVEEFEEMTGRGQSLQALSF